MFTLKLLNIISRLDFKNVILFLANDSSAEASASLWDGSDSLLPTEQV